MKVLFAFWSTRADWFNPHGRERRIKNYISLANQLVWKRQLSFLSAAILAAFYFDPIAIFISYALIVLSEMLDILLGRQSEAWDGKDPIMGRRLLKRITINTAVSATAIGAFIITMAVQQNTAGHFTPLFFLFSASVFAAMYNSQMKGILLLRLSIYGIAFLYVAFLDIFRYFPPLSSNIWLEFFTIIFVLYFICDISVKFYLNYQERLQQMRLIKAENKRTKNALEIKSQIMATVSHELRTPLTSIIGSLELIKSDKLGALPEELKPILSIAARNGNRLARLVEDLLDLQKLEAGEMVFRFAPINVNDLVSEAVASTSGYANKLGIQVTTAPFRDNCQIAGDDNRLIQALNNLLSNAIKFSNKGGVVKVRIETLGHRIRISVEDDGIGIPKKAKDRVFQRFSQVDSSDARKIGGAGLGLSITKQIVERHNGTIDYISELGAGSTFYIEFDQLSAGDDQSAVLEALAKAA